jgi:hypothetical protein
MARIFPTTLANYDFKEPTEERVFAILKNLPDDCRVWYEVVLGVRERKPDFMVLDPQRGIIILEVKGWSSSTIVGASPTEIRIMTSGGKTQRVKNPIRKCKVYLEEAVEKLELEPALIGKYDKLLFPVEYFVVLPNLSEEEFDKLGLADEKLELDRNRILFQKEVKNQTLFFKKLFSNIPELKKPLSADMQLAIRRCLREENTIEAPGGREGLLPGIRPEGKIEIGEQLGSDIFAIDIEQEELAKDLGNGPRLMRGIAGTGKTLIMLMRAKLLASNSESQNTALRILLLCWNVSLANYMRQAFDSINIPFSGKAHTNIFGNNGVPIVHFMEFARQLVKSHGNYFPRSDDPNFEQTVTEKLAGLKINATEQYDVIIVDEAQDFQDEWLKFLFQKMMKGEDPKLKNFIVAADDAQRVYKSRTFTWAGLGIPMAGERSKILRKIYRNSARVWGFAGFLLGDIKKFYDENPELRFTPKRGVDPKLIECKSLNEQIEVCIKEIKAIGECGYSWRNVLILYHSKYYRGFPVIETLLNRLDEEYLPYEWITESMESKNTFKWEKDSIKISTAISAKGMDAPKVIILNAESYTNSDDDYDETKVMYVALTRAREELVVLHTGNLGIVPELQKCYSSYKKARPALIAFEKQAKDLAI